jgi:hypothetical protein
MAGLKVTCKNCGKKFTVSTICGTKVAKNSEVYKTKLCPSCYDKEYNWLTGKKWV